MGEASKKVDQLKVLHKKREADIQQLGYSIALGEAVPDVFSDGKIKVRWSSDKPHLWPEHWTMTITKGNSEVVTVPLKDHLDADWINRIQKPSRWDIAGGRRMTQRIRRQKLEAEKEAKEA